MGGKIQTTYPLEVHNRLPGKNSCILIPTVSNKVVQAIVNDCETSNIWHFLALLDYVSKAHDIEIRPSSVRP